MVFQYFPTPLCPRRRISSAVLRKTLLPRLYAAGPRRPGIAHEYLVLCRETLLNMVDATADTLYENYDGVTHIPVGAPQFGWSAVFVIEFLLNW